MGFLVEHHRQESIVLLTVRPLPIHWRFRLIQSYEGLNTSACHCWWVLYKYYIVLIYLKLLITQENSRADSRSHLTIDSMTSVIVTLMLTGIRVSIVCWMCLMCAQCRRCIRCCRSNLVYWDVIYYDIMFNHFVNLKT